LVIKAVRGTRDLLPPETAVWNFVESIAREVFRAYNFQEIRTPIFEETALFARGVGEETDIVAKEMYTWDDQGISVHTQLFRRFLGGRLGLHRFNIKPPKLSNLQYRPDIVGWSDNRMLAVEFKAVADNRVIRQLAEYRQLASSDPIAEELPVEALLMVPKGYVTESARSMASDLGVEIAELDEIEVPQSLTLRP
jgi:hypothetical protein